MPGHMRGTALPLYNLKHMKLLKLSRTEVYTKNSGNELQACPFGFSTIEERASLQTAGYNATMEKKTILDTTNFSKGKNQENKRMLVF